MLRRIHSILLLLVLLIGGAGMNYVQAANVTLTLTASPAAGGRVKLPSGTWSTASNGTVSQSVVSGKALQIQAEAFSGYTFSKWSDNNTNATRAIQITSNKTYTAYFIPNSVTLTVTSNNTNYGTVTGGGTYNYNTSVTLTATPKNGYHFVQWSDGNTNASRKVTATANASYQATFAANTYTITFKNEDGTTLKTQTVNYNVTPTPPSNPTKAATAQYTYTFKAWSPTIVAATANATYTATYTATTRSYTIRFLNGSTVLQTNTLKYGATPSYTGSTPTKASTAQYAYTFSGWSPTIYAVNKAQDYTAQFSSTVRSYKITGASANTAMGTVSGTATKQYNQTVTLTATPKDCYKFVQWTDGNTSNPRTVTVQGTATYTATFEETISGNCGANGDNVKWYFNECTGALRIVGTGAMFDYSSYSTVPWYSRRTSITSVTIASGVTSIGNYAFSNCTNLTSVTIPSSVTSIGDNAFRSCYAMESVYITDLAAWCNISFSSRDSSPFNRNDDASHLGGGYLYVNGTKVTTLTIPNGITSIPDHAFYGFAGITSLQINKATVIGQYAFYGCHGLTTVTVPQGVTSIRNYSFTNCSHLQSISIPASVTYVGTGMLYNCYALTDIYASWTTTVPTWETNLTNKSPQSSITLHVPCGSGDPYRAANGWKDYTLQGSGTSNYTLTVTVNNNAAGTVRIDEGAAGTTVSKSMHCEDTHTITATSTDCYYFKQWNDGNTENPRKIGIGANKTYTAEFAEGYGAGRCGPNARWFLSCDGVLTISPTLGTGWMGSYTEVFDVPWYDYRHEIKSVVINPGIKNIGSLVFCACDNLTSVTIPSSVNSIDISAFHSCSSLTSITIPSSVTSIGNYAFANCSSLTVCAIPSSVTSIGTGLFNGCSSLTSVTIPSSVTSIGDYAFRNCTALTSVTIPSSVTSIGSYAFNNTGLTDIHVSWTTAEAIPTWKNYMTQTNDIFLHVPCGSSAYYMAKDGWKEYNIRGGCGTSYTLTVASDNNAYGLVQIDKGTPAASITEPVYTDDSHRITAVPVDACHHLVQWNDGNTDNPRNVMPNTNTTYTATFAEEQYSGTCGANLTWVLECDSTLRISGTGEMSDYSTSPWINLSNVIKRVVIEEGVTSIGNYAFYRMENIVSVSTPSTLTTIGTLAFYNCFSLESINLPDGLTSLGRGTTGHGPFYGCYSLRSIYIPASVTNISKDAFLRCYSLTSIVVDPANTVYDSRDNCNAIIETSINKLWYGCQTTVIPDGVLTVSDYAFEYQHNLKSIRISNTVRSFGTYVFKECENLKDIYVEWTSDPPQNILTTWSEHVSLNTTITVHVPCGYKSLYNSSWIWNRYQIVDDHLKGGMCGAQGSNQTWMLSCDGHLDIKGIGAMADYSAGGAPWNEHKDAIHTVTFADGINTIGENAFAGFTNLTDIYAPWTENIPVLPASNNPQPSVRLHIACSAISAYQAAGWGNYTIEGEYTASGTCGAEGDNLTWTLCDSTLTISGTGEMHEWTNSNYAPWYSYQKIITSVIIEDGVSSIGSKAFLNCSKLTSLTIPPSVTSISNIAFYNCSMLESLYISDLAAWCNINFGGITASPFYSNGGFGSGKVNLYVNGTQVTALTIPDGVTTISNYAFLGFAGITDIQFNQVTTIGSYAFCSCHGLTNVTIPEGVTTIHNNSFNGCSQLQSMSIPASAVSVENEMMFNCEGLTDIYVHWTENIPTWPSYFTNKSPQSDITIHVPCGAEELYSAATGWKDYTIEADIPNVKSGTYGPDNIEWTFDYCDSLLTITGNGELQCDQNTWGPNAGGINPNAVKSVFIGKGVTYLGIYTLSYMTNIEYIEIEEGHPTHRTGCNAIIRIGSEQEGDTLIFGCPHTVIPTTCTTIRGYAFWDNHRVTEMTIPSSVKQIANMQGSLWQGNNGQVFYTSNSASEGLKDLYVEWTKLEDIPAVPNNRLGDMTKVRLHVPCGTTSLYKQVTGWSKFKEYIEESATFTITVQAEDPEMGDVSIIVN
ncbi:MAG: leucine-rich repeat protein [Paludibacteraceae bacterium]|nr:leucine-rich repeat protein [Paludibacteraceae bacterium]MBO6306823.1 leucine-rich repeat protein [Paludibacteraceae bacterium]